MYKTAAELAEELAILRRQVTALAALAGIESAGNQRTGRPGHPRALYDADAVLAAYREESARTSRPFEGSDWLGHALLGRDLIRADPQAGALWWTCDGTRAEQLQSTGYGRVAIGGCFVPAHRVIWIAAEGEIPPCMQVNHLNKLRWDNRRANLELVTAQENIRHMVGLPYLSRDEAVRQLAELDAEPLMPEPDLWGELMRAPGPHLTAPPGMPVRNVTSRSRVRRH